MERQGWLWDRTDGCLVSVVVALVFVVTVILLSALLLMPTSAIAAPAPFLSPEPRVGQQFYWERYHLRVIGVHNGVVTYNSVPGNQDWQSRMSVQAWERIVRRWPQPKRQEKP